MIHATICIKTEMLKGVGLSSAGIILRSESSGYDKFTGTQQLTQEKKQIGVFFGSCSNYSAYVRALLVTLEAIKPEKRKIKLNLLFDKKTHLSNIIKSKKKDELLLKLHESLSAFDYEVVNATDDADNSFLFQAAALASKSYERKSSAVE